MPKTERLETNPISLFKKWFADAQSSRMPHPETMTLATATRKGTPSARTVLLKGINHGAFTFFTNYESRKAEELSQNPRAALVFYWEEIYRQVRIEGRISKLSRKENDAYFASRNRGSQIGAWASDQSRAIASRSSLERNVDLLEEKYKGKPVPRPPHWGGYKVIPTSVEFWTGRENRLHDRVLYRRQGSGWKASILAP